MLFARIDTPFVAVPDPQSVPAPMTTARQGLSVAVSRGPAGLSRHIPKQYLALVCEKKDIASQSK
jgi:hypothetical protein